MLDLYCVSQHMMEMLCVSQHHSVMLELYEMSDVSQHRANVSQQENLGFMYRYIYILKVNLYNIFPRHA